MINQKDEIIETTKFSKQRKNFLALNYNYLNFINKQNKDKLFKSKQKKQKIQVLSQYHENALNIIIVSKIGFVKLIKANN